MHSSSSMGKRGLEPLRLAAHDPKSCSSASSDTSPYLRLSKLLTKSQQRQRDLLTEFLSSRRQGLSAHTIAFYGTCLKPFVDSYELTPEGINSFLVKLQCNTGGKFASVWGLVISLGKAICGFQCWLQNLDNRCSYYRICSIS
jgi:hypothetical protein